VEPDFLSVFLVGSQVQQLPSLQRRHLSYCRPLWNGRHVLDTTRPPSADCSVPGLHAATIAGVLHSLVVPILSLSQVFSFVMIFSCQSHWQRFSGFGTSCTNYQYATAVVLISARVFMHSRTFFPMVIAAFSLPIIIVLSPSSSSTVTQFRLIQTVEAEAIAPPENLTFSSRKSHNSHAGSSVLPRHNIFLGHPSRRLTAVWVVLGRFISLIGFGQPFRPDKSSCISMRNFSRHLVHPCSCERSH
jgi:hypothetical protein